MNLFNVRVLKLVSGEEIIGRNVGETSSTITLDRVLTLALQPTSQQGQVGIATFPFLASTDGEIIINKQHIIGEPANLDQELISDYIDRTSPIKLA